jgi:hypothetical protein
LHDHPGGVQPGARPGTGDIATNFPSTRPGAGGGGIQRPTTLPGQGGGGIQRPTTRPGQDGGGIQRPTTRPGQDGGRIQRPTTRPGEGGSGTQRPGLRPDGRPDGRPGGGDWANNRPNRIPDSDRWNNWRENNFTNINNYWDNHWNDHDGWFDNDWCDRHDCHFPYHDNFNYWAWAAWPAMTGWIDYGWSEPVYYNYGENVYYQDDQVYYGDQVVASAADYAAQAEAIATNVPQTAPAAEDWMPLGVYAISQDGEPTGAEPTMYLQLAVSKQGVLSGAFQNTATDSAKEVEGMVDKQTQRAAWVVKGQTRPLMETGIVNLTEDTAPALLHFADGTTQQWLLVRLDKPADPNAPATK